MLQAIEYNLDKSVITSDMTKKHYLMFSQWIKIIFIFKTSRFILINAYVPLVVYLLFHEGKQKFLVQEDEEETLKFLRVPDIYFLFCFSLCETSAEQTHQKAAE